MATAVVTGANRGIGLALCKTLRERGFDVIGVCRACSSELQALDVQVVADIDVRERASLDRLAAELGARRIDLLILNAGVLAHESLGELDDSAFERIRLQLEINALGPLRCVEALVDKMAEHGKVGLITSRMGSLEDNSSGGYYGYRMSKAALNAAGRSLAHDLRPRGIAVFMLHPGFVRTDMTDRRGDVEPQQAAANLVDRLHQLSLNESGSFWHANGQPLPW